MYARLHNFAAVCQTLAGDELMAFVNDARRALSEPVLKLGGEIAQRRPDSILAVFSNKPDARKPDHAQRGLHAAILAVYESVQLAARVAAGSVSPGSPRLAVAVGVNLGPAEISGRGVRSNGMVHATGEAVEVTRLLELTASDLRWSIAASGRTLRASAGRAEAGRIGSVAPPDNSFVDIVEIKGLVPRRGSKTRPEMYRLLREAIAQNDVAWERSHDPVSAGSVPGAPPSGTHHLLVEGYRVLRQIGAGGMATVYLAEAKEGGAPQVLKVMRMEAIPDDDGLQRFIQEFALVAQIRHPNVARIYRQDFSAGNAYIAMEYFSGGDLRGRIAQGISRATAIDYLKQIAAGLAAIHEAGIVHRDLKPDNLMLRQDGTLALADFGVAKQVSMLIMDTGDGDVVGTPSYLSPEQAKGLSVDARCDLYSLGVLTYEMLTGRRPYQAANTQAMLDLHINGAVPVLGAQHEALQPVLNRLMAKNRDQRYPSALALLKDLAERGL
jgi:tRNA A-37 threonylcarbamoyl transferase component Bud32/class 3 adenylate cyclase